MDKQRAVVVLKAHKTGQQYDVDLPLDISANELILALNQAYRLGMDTSDLSRCYLKTENPIALLRGNKLLVEYGLHNGSVIHYTG